MELPLLRPFPAEIGNMEGVHLPMVVLVVNPCPPGEGRIEKILARGTSGCQEEDCQAGLT
ncbi:hypothetical protein D3C76_1662300 [compost metagenome]